MFVCLSVTNFKLILLFCFSTEPSHFRLSVFHNPSTKLFSSIFELGPITPKNLLPEIGQKTRLTWLVWHIDRRCLRLPGGRPGGGPTLVAMATTFALGAESNRLPACLFVRSFVALACQSGNKPGVVFAAPRPASIPS